jgi:hypothetical protein
MMNNHINFLKALILGCLFLTGTVFAVWPHKEPQPSTALSIYATSFYLTIHASDYP